MEANMFTSEMSERELMIEKGMECEYLVVDAFMKDLGRMTCVMAMGDISSATEAITSVAGETIKCMEMEAIIMQTEEIMLESIMTAKKKEEELNTIRMEKHPREVGGEKINLMAKYYQY